MREILNWIESQSVLRAVGNVNHRPFHERVTINNELWREAYGWKSNTTKQIRQRNGIYVSVESGAIDAFQNI